MDSSILCHSETSVSLSTSVMATVRSRLSIATPSSLSVSKLNLVTWWILIKTDIWILCNMRSKKTYPLGLVKAMGRSPKPKISEGMGMEAF